ncbi:hypothetical protein D3C86_1980860 [compost metagenome]
MRMDIEALSDIHVVVKDRALSSGLLTHVLNDILEGIETRLLVQVFLLPKSAKQITGLKRGYHGFREEIDESTGHLRDHGLSMGYNGMVCHIKHSQCVPS